MVEDKSFLFQSRLESSLGLIVLAHIFNPSTPKAEAGGSLCVSGQSSLVYIASSRQGRDTWRDPILKKKESKPRKLFFR